MKPQTLCSATNDRLNNDLLHVVRKLRVSGEQHVMQQTNT